MNDVAMPRAVAARVTVRAIAVTQRILACFGIPLAALLVVDVLVDRGAAHYVPVIVAPYLGALVLALLLLWRPGVATATLFLLGGAVCQCAVTVVGLDAVPTLDEPSAYLLNRLATALCLVGAVGATALSGLVWTVVAALVAHVSLVGSLWLAGSTAAPGFGPLIVATVSVGVYLTLLGAQRRVDSRLEPLRVSSEEAMLDDLRAKLERRAASIVHDTLLADLAAVARSQGALAPRAAAVLTSNERRLSLATVAEAAAEHQQLGSDGDTRRNLSRLAQELRNLAHEYQWSGVRVDVSGIEVLAPQHDPDIEVHCAVIESVRAALDNVVKHARTDRAELVAGVRDDRLSVLIVDDGVGFSHDDVADDRLGMRLSIEERIVDVGGSLRIWSSDEGTTVMLTVPLEARS